MDKPCHSLEGKVYCIDRGCRLPSDGVPSKRCNRFIISRTDHGHRRPRRSQPSAPAGEPGRSVPLLAQARLHQLRRPDRPDRDHAPGPGRAETLDLREALPARAQLLHGIARPRGAAARDLHRLDDASHLGRGDLGRVVRAALALHPDRADVDLSRVRRRTAGQRALLRHQARGHRDRAVRRLAHRLARAQERLAVGDQRGRVHCDLRVSSSVSRDRARGRRPRIPGRAHRARQVRHRRPRVGSEALRRGADRRRPAHALFRWPHFAGILGVFLFIWVGTLGVLIALSGWQSTFTQMGWFFTKAALLTFGGAYAVLPYVYQGAVENYHWLTATQMIDGLALGETTPGPLIMVVAFVGFVGAWTKAALGVNALALAGCAGATVATFFTFLPSFLFILLGGPLVESTHGNLKFTAPLTGITAAVVGVILNLAAFFAWHVLWPEGFAGRFDAFSLLVGLAALAALWRYRNGMIPVIFACGAAGLVYRLLAS